MHAGGTLRAVSLAVAISIVAAAGITVAGATPGPPAAQHESPPPAASSGSSQPPAPPTVSDAPLIDSPAALLGTLKTTHIQIQRASPASFFDVFVQLSPQANIGASCNMLIAEVARKGYRRNGQPLPTTCAALRSSTFTADSFFDITFSDGQRTDNLVAASLGSDVNPATGSRSFFDIFIDLQNPAASIVQATLTNNWSDQPEVVKAAKGNLRVNGENRFFVDVARVISEPVAGGSPQLVLLWYHYWWYDSHNHYWWWYGPYTWWFYQYSWYGGTWWWWWNAWWPWWHGYHWYFWSNWWSDLNFIARAGPQPAVP